MDRLVSEKKIRSEIAGMVEEKMQYMSFCLNEQETILNIILDDIHPFKIHCNTDCRDSSCKLYKNIKE